MLEGPQDDDEGVEIRQRWLHEAKGIRSVVDLLLAQPEISSEMIDKTNGLIVMRFFLTDLFFADHVWPMKVYRCIRSRQANHQHRLRQRPTCPDGGAGIAGM